MKISAAAARKSSISSSLMESSLSAALAKIIWQHQNQTKAVITIAVAIVAAAL